jgi:hypothetical protein
VFSFIPEVGLNIGYDITPNIRIFGGGSVMYWRNVARPGSQIDRGLDTNLINGFPAAPPATQVRPAPLDNLESVWIYGANFGLLFKW